MNHTITPELIIHYGQVQAENDSLRAELAELRARAGELERQVRDKHEAATVDEICNAYESGVGHRGRPTASVNPYRKGSDLATAYNIGALGDRESPAAAAVPDDVAKNDARYRWLRDGNYDKDTEATNIAVNMFGFEWDDAIDAAILAAKVKP